MRAPCTYSGPTKLEFELQDDRKVIKGWQTALRDIYRVKYLSDAVLQSSDRLQEIRDHEAEPKVQREESLITRVWRVTEWLMKCCFLPRSL